MLIMNRKWHYILVCLISIVTISFSCTNDDNEIVDFPKENEPSSLFNERLFICHRGLDGYPENTLVAIEAAINAGYKAIECDIEITKDGIPVLSHDKTIDRCSNGRGRISDMTYLDLLQYDFGSWKDSRFTGEKIPTLDEVLKQCKKYNVILELDLAGKIPGERIDTIYNVVANNDMLDLTLFTARDNQLKVFLSQKKDVCISISGVYNLDIAMSSLYLRDYSMYSNFSLPADSVKKEIVEYAHTTGVKVKTWPVDEASKAKMLFNMGVDYIQTNVLGPEL